MHSLVNKMVKKTGHCYGFVWQGFGSGEAIGVVSVRSCKKLPPCLLEPVPAGSDGHTTGQGQANQRQW